MSEKIASVRIQVGCIFDIFVSFFHFQVQIFIAIGTRLFTICPIFSFVRLSKKEL